MNYEKRKKTDNNKSVIIISLFALLVLVASCSERNPEAPLYNEVHPQSWFDPNLINTEDFHGTTVRGQGTVSCEKCHNVSGTGEKDIPGCFTCHFGPGGSKAPPGSGWSHGAEEHSELEIYEITCNTCHDLQRSFNIGPSTCHDCHGEATSHVLGQEWLDKNSQQFHGEASLEDCSSCHDLNEKCSECHFDETGSRAPVGSGWEHGSNEEHKDYEGQSATCDECHNLNRSYGNEPASCHDCHVLENHVTGQAWLDKNNLQFHGEVSQEDCSTCHDLNEKCSQCHFDETGSKAPAGSGWNHGDNEEHREYERYDDICNQCHDLNRSYGNDPSSCHDCHEEEDDD